MNKIIAFGIAVALMATAIPGVEAANRTETTYYLPGGIGLLVWCSEEEHSLIPTYDPPLDDPENIDGWLFSGEPECVYADAVNAVNDATGNDRESVGIGAAAWTLLPSDLGGILQSSTDDDFYGANTAFQRIFADTPEGREATEGCGTQSFAVPDVVNEHWQSDPEDPYYLAWTAVPIVGVDEDLSICFASSGFVTAEFIN